MRADVIVVGAGPVGLMLAGELRLGGADVVVVDRLAAPTGESRALGFTRRVAEILDQRGLLKRLGEVRQGQQGHFGGIRLDLSRLEESHHGVLGLSQARTEALLTDRLAELGVRLLREHELVGLRQEGAEGDGSGRVVVELDTPGGRVEAEAAWLVGCDGGQGATRAAAGFVAPATEATRGMYMADVTGVEPRPRPIGEKLPGGNMALAVSLGDGYHRIVLHESSLRPPAGEVPSFATVADAWQRVTGESLHAGTARWTSAFSNSCRVVGEYRRGRVLLAGDAAHDLPPLAGWSLSVGLQEAVNLGWKLAAVVTGRAPEELVDTYESERLPLGRQLYRNHQAASLLYLTGDELEPVRAVLRELAAAPEVAGHLAGMVSGLAVQYDLGPGHHPALGRRLSPDRVLETAAGDRRRVADLLEPGRGVLISTDPAGREAARIAEGWGGQVDHVDGRWADLGDVPVAQAALGSALVRPDGYVAWATPDDAGPEPALSRWFGPARAGSSPARMNSRIG